LVFSKDNRSNGIGISATNNKGALIGGLSDKVSRAQVAEGVSAKRQIRASKAIGKGSGLSFSGIFKTPMQQMFNCSDYNFNI